MEAQVKGALFWAAETLRILFFFSHLLPSSFLLLLLPLFQYPSTPYNLYRPITKQPPQRNKTKPANNSTHQPVGRTGRPSTPDLRDRAGGSDLSEQGRGDPGSDGARPVQRGAQCAVEQRAGAVLRAARHRARAGQEARRRVGRAALRPPVRLR